MSKIYARSDVMGVAVPEESGGCGTFHGRPVTNGKPADSFEIDCPRCSAALRGDPQWSARPDDLPKTPDEQARDDEEAQRGLITKKEDLVSGIAEGLASGLRNLTSCRGCGKMNPSGMKFCGECGHQLGAPAATPVPAPSEEPKNAQDTADDVPDDLGKKRVDTLRKMAREKGLSTDGSKDDLIKRLKEEG